MPFNLENTKIMAGLKLPLKEEQRLFIYKQMIWWCSLTVLSKEDYHLLSRPKKVASTQFSFWGLGMAVIGYQYSVNPQVIYQRLVNPIGLTYVALAPLAITAMYFRKQKKTNQEVYERTFGKMDDQTLLEFYFRFR